MPRPESAALLISLGLLAGLCLPPSASAEDPPVVFRTHVINAASEFSACAVFDVNHDGRLDIFSGGYWYEAPEWTRHRVRDVENIRGRFDDYSNLPLDVNADGWLDVVSVNYRSQSLYWVEHPGAGLGSWTKHVIATPGSSETGRLADVDGDGRLDILPNGTQFAGWWRLEGQVAGQPRWSRQLLPEELAGHGLGIGDVNGDGRDDLVCPRGWAEAPADRVAARWVFHDDLRLPRDCSIPILVEDVDGDGDADLVYGRGHNIGLYWVEQKQSADGQRTWTEHAIDTSISEAHSLLWADVDGDGRQDLIAGKRYMGHDGKDPGEYDPLVVAWYRFMRETHTWRRSWISWGGPAGFDLDPKAADIDGDGDVDIVGAARSGLFLFENQRVQESPERAAPITIPDPDYPSHQEPLVLRQQDGALVDVTDREQWGLRRAHILAGLERAMGPLPGPSQRVPLDVRVLEEQETPAYTRYRITYAADPGDRVPAWLLIPRNVVLPRPAMLCLHPTSRHGKDLVAGLASPLPHRNYGHELAIRGFVCLIPDYPSFGEYEDYDFAANRERYPSGSMKAIWNNIRALDLLETRPEVQRDRIGCIGHSLGGHNTLFTACFDQRIRAAVTSCGFTAFHKYYEGNLKGWTSDRYMPRIRDIYHNDPNRVPFDFQEVIAAIAPRPLFISAPLHDSNFEVSGVRDVVAAARPVYALCGAASALQVEYPDEAHDFPGAIREQVYVWLEEQLGQ